MPGPVPLAATPLAARPPAAAPPGDPPRRRRRWVYVPRLALHALYRTACAPLLREGCRTDEPACARNFAVRGYRHHSRGLDTPPCCRARLLGLLEKVTSTLTDAGVPHFAFWGTFLGALRHRGLIPWDRDADLVLLERDRARVLAALAALTTSGPAAAWLHVPPRAPHDLRVQASRANSVGVDLEFWQEDGPDWVHAADGLLQRFPVRDLLPLRTRPFEHLMLPTPASPRALLSHYGPDCLTRGVRRDQVFGRTEVVLRPGPGTDALDGAPWPPRVLR